MIYLTQWLCANRHCSIALAWDDQTDSEGAMAERGEDLYRSGLVNRWCGLCGSDLAPDPEHGQTPFTTRGELLEFLSAGGNLSERVGKC